MLKVKSLKWKIQRLLMVSVDLEVLQYRLLTILRISKLWILILCK